MRPREVCISMDKEAEGIISTGRGKQVTLNEALEALQRSHEAGLVHISYTDKDKSYPLIISICCSCCCHSLGGLVRFEIPEAVVESKLVAIQDSDACMNCGTCVNRCQFQARKIENGTLNYNISKCFGCGVCISTCPENAILLVTRSQD